LDGCCFHNLFVHEPLGVVDMVTYYGPIKEYKAKNMIKGDWEHKNRVIEYLTNTHGFLERFTHLDNETWLLAEYRNTLTGHVHYIPVESCEHAEWVLRCMNHHGKFEFVELYKKEE